MIKEATKTGRDNTSEQKERSTGIHFLIVEDNPVNIQTAQEYLRQGGDELSTITVDFAKDYDEANDRLEKGRYNGVITDLFFPKKTGSNGP